MAKLAWDSLVSSPLEREIMKQVLFWHPRAKAVREGHRWIVWSYQELKDRLPLFGSSAPSDRTLNRCLTHLRGVGLLITERHRHPFMYMRGPVLWLRPNVANLSPNWREHGVNLASTNIQTTEEQKTDNKISAAPDGTPLTPSQEHDDMQGADLLKKGKKAATIENALAVFEHKKTEQDYPSITKPELAHKALRDACIANGWPSPGSFNVKRGGQMKTLLRRCKEEGLSPEEIGPLIFFVASKWAEFIGYMKDTFGVVVKGTAPNHDALTQYAVEMVGFWQGYAKSQKVEKPSEHGSSLDEGF